MYKDDGLSPVVGIMMVLVVLVVCATSFAATYIPELKESAEIEHSQEVLNAFMKFSSDADTIYSKHQGGTFTQVFSLGGGDVLFSPSKSGGTVEIKTLTNTNYSLQIGGESPVSIPLKYTKVTYTPILPYWENQGYKYEKGVVWVCSNGIQIPKAAGINTLKKGNETEDRNFDAWAERMFDSPSVTKSGDTENWEFCIVEFAGDDYISGSSEAVIKIEAKKDGTLYSKPDIPKNTNVIFYKDLVPASSYTTSANNTSLTLTKILATVSVE